MSLRFAVLRCFIVLLLLVAARGVAAVAHSDAAAHSRFRNCEDVKVSRTTSNDEVCATCEVYSGHAAVVLVGPSNASSQSPLRSRGVVDVRLPGGNGMPGASLYDTVASRDVASLLSALLESECLSRLVSFPWNSETVRRFFLRQEVVIEHVFAIDRSEKQLHGPSVAALAKASAMLKLVSFSPSVVDGALVCDTEVIADGIKVNDLCSARSVSVLPQGLREILGISPVSSSLSLTPLANDSFRATCAVQSSTVTSFCVRIAAIQASSTYPLQVSWAARTGPDVMFAYVFALFFVLTFVQRLVESSRVAQLMCAGLFGVFILGSVAVVYVVRDFSKTKLGKVGIAGMITLGGVAALTEGFLSAMTAYVAVEVQRNIIVQLILVALYFVSAAGAHFMLGGRLPQATSLVVRAGRYFVALVCFAYNPEATVIGSLSVATSYLLVTFLAWPLLLGVLRSPLALFGRDEGEPRDDLPPAASVEVRYARPLAASKMRGTQEEKFRQYQREGNEFTRRALEELAAKVRENPAKYSSKVVNPNQLVSWAGESCPRRRRGANSRASDSD